MSLTSHAVNRLRKLWKTNYVKNAELNINSFEYPADIKSKPNICLLEPLEPRLMMSAAANTYEVWGGNESITEYYRLYDIDEQGYTKLGSANETATFDGQYDYYVIVSKGPVEVDTSQGSDGAYGRTTRTGNTENEDNFEGIPDDECMTLGTRDSGYNYWGFAVVNNLRDWSSLTVYIGSDKFDYDLTVEVNTYEAGTYNPDDSFYAGGNIFNNSSLELDQKFSVEARLSKDQIWDESDYLIGRWSKDGMTPWDTYKNDGLLNIPEEAAAGSYYLLTMVDVDNEVVESNETNNLWVSENADIIVESASLDDPGQPPLPYPNRTVGIDDYSQGEFEIGQTFELDGWIENSETATPRKTPVIVGLYLSADNQFQAGTDIFLGSKNMGSLGTQDFENGHASIDIPLDMPAGSYHLIAVIDPDNSIRETNETDNVWVSDSANITISNEVTLNSRGMASLYDSNGSLVNVRLKGTGGGYVIRDDNGDIANIVLEDTTSRSSLTISTKSRATTTIGGIEVDGLIKSISGKTANLTGEVNINKDGDAVGSRDYTSLTFGAVYDSVIDTNGLPIKSLKIANWDGSYENTDEVDDSIIAPWIGSISVKGQKDNRRTAENEALDGNFAADINLDDVDRRGYALGKAAAKGLWSGDINTGQGYIGSLSVGQWNADLTAGYLKSFRTKSLRGTDINGGATGTVTITDTDNRGNAIKSLSIAGNAADFIINAGNGAVGNITVGNWENGSLAAGVIKSLITKANRRNDEINGDFGADVTLDPTWYNQNFRPAKQTLRSAKIANDITGGTWNITGLLGSVRASGRVDDWTLNANGDAKSLMFGGLFDSQLDIDGSIGRVDVRGWRLGRGEEISSFTSGSTISADYIKSASLMNWDTENMTQLVVPINPDREDGTGNVARLSYKDTRPESKERWSWKPGQPDKWDESIEPIVYIPV